MDKTTQHKKRHENYHFNNSHNIFTFIPFLISFDCLKIVFCFGHTLSVCVCLFSICFFYFMRPFTHIPKQLSSCCFHLRVTEIKFGCLFLFSLSLSFSILLYNQIKGICASSAKRSMQGKFMAHFETIQ